MKHSGDLNPVPNRQVVAFFITCEVIHHMGSRRETVIMRHGPAGQGGGLGIAEERERVPRMLPGAAGGVVSIEDEEVELLAAQVIAGGQAGLATTDDHAIVDVHFT